ncbi:MAG: peptidylprolyl isomerase [Candidatus Marinimicrobia bacterium]|nr:peptidylprolyl isomerase [Candidatus Neomarinimicrobiota bacterium]
MKKFLVLSIIVMLIIGCSDKPGNDTLLRLGNKYYSLLDFFEVNSKEQFLKIPEESKIKHIENWSENQLFLKAAEDKDYFKNNEKIKEDLENYKKQADIKYYLDRTILDSIITENILKDYYEKMAIEVNASHILLQHNGVKQNMQRTREEALNLANIITEKARSGEDFAALSKKYSEDTGSKETGNLGYFGPGKMVKEFEEAAFAMDRNEISNPVETQFGFHIIKVLDKRKKPVKPFNEERSNITNKLVAKYRGELQENYRKKVDELKEKYRFEINQSMIDTLIITAQKYKEENATKNIYDEMNVITAIEIPGPLGKYEGQEITLKEFTEKLKNTHMQLPPAYINDRYFKIVMENIYLSEIFLKEFKESGIPYNNDYNKEIDAYKRRTMTNEFKKELLSTDIDVTDEEIQNYYDEKKNKEFMNPSKAETREIFLYDSTEAVKILKEVLKNPDSFDDLSKEKTMRYNQKEKPGYFGEITSSQYGEIGKIANTMDPNTIFPEIIKAGKGWSIVKVYGKTEATEKELDTVRETIKSVLMQQKKSLHEKEMIEKLKKQYKFKIYWNCVNIEK